MVFLLALFAFRSRLYLYALRKTSANKMCTRKKIESEQMCAHRAQLPRDESLEREKMSEKSPWKQQLNCNSWFWLHVPYIKNLQRMLNPAPEFSPAETKWERFGRAERDRKRRWEKRQRCGVKCGFCRFFSFCKMKWNSWNAQSRKKNSEWNQSTKLLRAVAIL